MVLLFGKFWYQWWPAGWGVSECSLLSPWIYVNNSFFQILETDEIDKLIAEIEEEKEAEAEKKKKKWIISTM